MSSNPNWDRISHQQAVQLAYGSSMVLTMFNPGGLPPLLRLKKLTNDLAVGVTLKPSEKSQI